MKWTKTLPNLFEQCFRSFHSRSEANEQIEDLRVCALCEEAVLRRAKNR